MIEMVDWKPAATAPTNVWVRTKLEGENGFNVCMLFRDPDGNEEWIERKTGITTVTHSTFAAPSHWAPYP